MSPPPSKYGFTLVELSIVLVILGLLVGGVLSGQSLIRAAQLRGVSTESQNYTSAVYTFRDKYNALPGDMPNADRFWSGARSGSGDGTLCDVPLVDGSNVANSSNEVTAAWHHLASAKLIEGSFSASFQYNNNALLPKSRVPSSVWTFWHHPDISGTDEVCAGLALTSVVSHATKMLAPEEAWNIDKKMDDGRPRQGRVRSGALYNGYDNSTCLMGLTAATSSAPDTAEYLLGSPNKGCVLWLKY